MFELIIRDYRFTKKVLLFTLAYCIVVPAVLLIDNDAKYYLADLLIPLVMITAPMSKMMQMEDGKSGIILRKTLPLSSLKIVGARFLFGLTLLGFSEIILIFVKTYVFKTGNTGNPLKNSSMVFLGFTVYFAFYMGVYYWKGYFATQFCIYILIIVTFLGKKVIPDNVVRILGKIISNEGLATIIMLILLGISLLLCTFLEDRRRLDN